ncbi:MAG: S8 family serine peptidase, partial [Verrucomicrobiota bacterium]
MQPDWRDQLQRAGVELLRYVPEDAFVAKLNGVAPGQIRRMDFVRWMGRYRPEHKVHRDLLPGGARANAVLDVAIMLAPSVTETDAAAVKRSMASVSQESRGRFGRVIRGSLSAAQLDTLAQSDSVLWVEPAPRIKLFDEVSSKIVAGDGGPHTLLTQSLGYDGAGVKVAVADSGLDSGDTNNMHPDIAGRVSGLFFYGSPGQLSDAADEHSHGTHCAGIIAGNGAVGETDENGFLYGLGVAPGASLIGQRIFDANGGYAAPSSFEKLTRDAKRAGADIGSNSWGDDTQGRYDLSAMEFDGLVRDADALTLGDQAYILEFSAGNAGPNERSIGSPAVAKNVIATGAANSDRLNLPLEEFPIYSDGPDSMADFSSRGPCEDGRIKPDLVAPGSWIASLRSIYANDDYAWWPISDNYLYQGGTSQAGPHVSGAAAVFVQFYRVTHGGSTPSPALVKAALINSATDMDDAAGTAPVPNQDEGWGRLNLPALVGSTRDYDFVDQSVLLTNAAVYEKRILVGSADEPLKITLAYTDVPGMPSAVIALVNDLDLEVTAPDGRVYRGNQFEAGESIPNAVLPDTINNVEAVHLRAPLPGEYVIRVRATRVVEDARRETSPVDQDFALVVSARIAAPGAGIVTFDRTVYRAPDQIRLTLVDYNLAGQGSATVLLRSTAEPAGESITLAPMGVTGLFTGAVATVTGPALADGKLQVGHTNLIEAIYADAQPAANRVFTATTDLMPPVISNVQGTSRFGQVMVSWNTDEPANAMVYYGTNQLASSVSNNVFENFHELALPNIPPNSVQKFFVVSADAAGNRATNNNAGLNFTVTNLQSPDILLVDAFAENGLVSVPPLSGYTDALDAVGAAYNVFDATGGAEPTLAQLQSYRCVIWRTDELSPPSVTLAGNIRSYVTNGGSLLLASMESLTRFTEAGLASFNTDVLRVQSYTEDQSVDFIAGASGDPVGAGMDTALDYSAYEEFQMIFGADLSDWIVPNSANAAPVLQSDSAVVGLRSPKTGVDQSGRVVFFSFPLDAVPMDAGLTNNRVALLRNALNFLAPSPGSSSVTLDNDVYSLPGQAVVELDDLDLQGAGQATVTVQNSQHPGQINLTLAETVRHGLFRGSFLCVPTNTGAPGTLFAQSGDTIQVSYLDASASQTITATAVIDTNAPTISNVSIDPGYLEAVVTWETSKEADSLVQYGESPDNFPVNYTASDPVLTTQHELMLRDLKPNKTYYLRVVSRDRAGNVTTDNNNGQLYQFTTLLPRPLPWQDDMETPSVEWSTISPDESESGWTRGAPGQGESAHSPTNCWGSNLGGGSLGVA